MKLTVLGATPVSAAATGIVSLMYMFYRPIVVEAHITDIPIVVDLHGVFRRG